MLGNGRREGALRYPLNPLFLAHHITNIILVDAIEGLNGSRVEAYAKVDIRLDVICLIFA